MSERTQLATRILLAYIKRGAYTRFTEKGLVEKAFQAADFILKEKRGY